MLAARQTLADVAGRIDSMTSRAHQHAARTREDGHLRMEPPGGVHTEPADHTLGRPAAG